MSRILMKEGTDTGTPSTDYVSIYPQAGGRLYVKDDSGQQREVGAGGALTTPAGTGITAGSGTVYAASWTGVGSLRTVRIIIDLTGLNSKDTDLDIIGVNGTSNPCHIGRMIAAEMGTPLFGILKCQETPAGGDPNIALYAATEGTGVEDGLITDLTETLLYDPNADWAAGDEVILTTLPSANHYLYLVQGDATGTDATYTAGKFFLEILGSA